MSAVDMVTIVPSGVSSEGRLVRWSTASLKKKGTCTLSSCEGVRAGEGMEGEGREEIGWRWMKKR